MSLENSKISRKVDKFFSYSQSLNIVFRLGALVLLIALIPLNQTKATAEEKEKAKITEILPTQSIEFNRASAVLSAAQKRTIANLVTEVKDSDGMELTLAVWADHPLPPKGKELTGDQKKLAHMRSKVIKEFIETTNYKGPVTVFNMAEQSHWLSNMFNSTTKDLKSTLAYEKHGDNLQQEKFKVFKTEGKPRKAVLVLAKKI